MIPAGTKGAKGSTERAAAKGVNSRPPKYKIYDGYRNKRSVWNVNVKPLAIAHYATFPPALVEPPLLAETSARGCCSICGAPWKRIIRKTGVVQQREAAHVPGNATTKIDSTGWEPSVLPTDEWEPGCNHDAEVVPCTIMDIFAGSGTVGEVAIKHGRNAVLVELNPEYIGHIEQRVGKENIASK